MNENNMSQPLLPLWVYITASAATGALVSSLITLFSQWRERKWKRKELLLRTAAEMSFKNNEMVMQIAKDSNQIALIPSHIILVSDYYKSLNHLIDKNELPKAVKSEFAKSKLDNGIKL